MGAVSSTAEEAVTKTAEATLKATLSEANYPYMGAEPQARRDLGQAGRLVCEHAAAQALRTPHAWPSERMASGAHMHRAAHALLQVQRSHMDLVVGETPLPCLMKRPFVKLRQTASRINGSLHGLDR